MSGDCNSWKITGVSLGFHETKAALEWENISVCSVYSAKRKGYCNYD